MRDSVFKELAQRCPNLEPRTLAMARDHLVKGMTLNETAQRHGVTFQRVSAAVKRLLEEWEAEPVDRLWEDIETVVAKHCLTKELRDKLLQAMAKVLKVPA